MSIFNHTSSLYCPKVLSSVLGWLLLGGQLDIFVSIGAVATILAIFNYTLDP